MSGSESLTWNLIVDPSRGERGLQRFGQATQRAESRVSKFSGFAGTAFKAVGMAGVAGLGVAGLAFGKFVVDGVKAAQSYQVVLAKTSQVIKSTGGAAHVTTSHVKELSAELETLSGVDEELIINSQNVLMTFTNIKNGVGKSNQVFDMATKAALDMSVALKSDLQGASIQVGKALNDPVKGVSALSKVGVTFTEGQKKVIASLVKTGDTAGAQKVILKELNKEFGGQAAAAGATFEGSLARVQDVIGDTGRELGQALLPKLTEAADWLGDKLPGAVQDFKDGWKGIGEGQDINGLATAIHDLSTQLTGLAKQTGDMNENGFVTFAKTGINAVTTFVESFSMLGSNWALVTTRIEQWNAQIGISFQKMINNISAAGAKLPGPMGRHFKRIHDEGVAELSKMQGKMDKINTKRARAELNIAEIELRRLGRQKPSPKVSVKTANARAEIARLQAKLHNIKDRYVNVFISETKRDSAMAGRSGGIPGRALGGAVAASSAYVVGEEGPEIFVPSSAGTVITASRSKLLMSERKREQLAQATKHRSEAARDAAAARRAAQVAANTPKAAAAHAANEIAKNNPGRIASDARNAAKNALNNLTGGGGGSGGGGGYGGSDGGSNNRYFGGRNSNFTVIKLYFNGRPLVSAREIRQMIHEALKAAPAGGKANQIANAITHAKAGT